MSSELAIEQFGPQLTELQRDCEGLLTVDNLSRELVYGYEDLRDPLGSRWQILEGAEETSALPEIGEPVAEVVVMDHEINEDRIAAARSGVEEFIVAQTPRREDLEHSTADVPRACHVVDRFHSQPMNAHNDGGHVGVAEIYDEHGNEYITVTTIGINGVASYVQARLTSTDGEIREVSIVELDAEDMAVFDRCAEVFGQNSAAAALIEGGYLRTLDHELEEIRRGAEGIVPEDVLDDLLAAVRDRAAKNERARLGFNGVTEERIARLREFVADL